MATDYDHANEALQDDAGKVSNAAHKGVHAAKTAKKTFGKLKKGVDAVSNNPVVLLQKVKIALYIFAAIVIIACVSMIPSIISNIFLHQSDPEELSAKSDFLEFENDDELETSLKEVYDDDRNAFYKDVQKDAYREAQDDLLATAPAGYVIDPWKGDSLEKMPDEDMVLLCSAYNACNSNALDDFMFEEYQETTSTDDFIKICKTLLEKPNAEYPNGNALYGTDWVRDALVTSMSTRSSPAMMLMATPSLRNTLSLKFIWQKRRTSFKRHGKSTTSFLTCSTKKTMDTPFMPTLSTNPPACFQRHFGKITLIVSRRKSSSQSAFPAVQRALDIIMALTLLESTTTGSALQMATQTS